MTSLPTPRKSIPSYDSTWLELIPATEAAVFKAYYLVGLSQMEIAAALRINQAGVSYILKRCKQRFDFLESTPLLDEKEIREILSPVFDGETLTILVSMRQTTCQSLTAKHLGLNQGKVRFRFLKAVDQLRELAKEDSSYFRCYKMFRAISESFNILKAVGPRTSPEDLARLAQLLPPPSPPMEQQTPPSEEKLLQAIKNYLTSLDLFVGAEEELMQLLPGCSSEKLMELVLIGRKESAMAVLELLKTKVLSKQQKEPPAPVKPAPPPKAPPRSTMTLFEALCEVVGDEELHVAEILGKLNEIGAAPRSKNPRNVISSHLSSRKDVFEKMGGGFWRRLDPNSTPPAVKKPCLKGVDQLAYDLGTEQAKINQVYPQLTEVSKFCLNSYYKLHPDALAWSTLGKRYGVSAAKMKANLKQAKLELQNLLKS